MNIKKLLVACSLFAAAAFTQSAFAQGLNYEGQTGAVLTPYAYTTASPSHKFGKPEVAFHYLNGGPVIGNEYQFSITEGFGKHFEAGFTQSFSSMGDSQASFLFNGGYSTLHGKLNFIPENFKKTKWVPAISVGALGRFDNHRGYWNIAASGPGFPTKASGDFYIVATKTITQLKVVNIILSGGEKGTNASLNGIFGEAGNGVNFLEQRWQGCAFGTIAFSLKGPAKSVIGFGGEVSQQPRYILPFGNETSVPTTLNYFISVTPHMEGSPLRFDVSVIQAAGRIAPGADLDARSRVGAGVSYHF